MATVQKDKDGDVLATGDLIMVLFDIDHVWSRTAERVIYKAIRPKGQAEDSTLGLEANETGTRELQYYPLTKEGVTLAKYENGDYDDGSEVAMFRTKDFTINDIRNEQILKLNTSLLRGAEKEYYDDIVALIT